MALMFYLSTNGSDNHSGSSEGSAKVAGSAGATTASSATVDLSSDSPDLSGVVVGDTIRLNGRTDGIHGSDIFEITGVDDGADTVTVTPSPTSSVSGVTWAIGGAWATPQRAMDIVSAGDTVRWKADGAYTDDGDSDGACAVIRRAATSTAPIVFEGYKNTPGDAAEHPDDDSYRVLIDGSVNALSVGIGIHSGYPSGAPAYYIIRHVKITSCSSSGFALSGQNARAVTLANCRSTGNGTGLVCGPNTVVHGGSVDGNSTGITGSTDLVLMGVSIVNNIAFGVSANAFVLSMCTLAGNGFSSVFQLSPGMIFVVNNTLDGQGASFTVGLDINVGARGVVADNILHDFATGARFTTSGGSAGRRFIIGGNLFSANGTDRANGFPAGTGDLAADDPGFIDESNGDYRLRFDSPSRGAGLSAHIDIGSHQRREIATHAPTNVGVQI